jgi:hypothetical protein
MAAQPPRIDPRLLRPSRVWYWVAGAIAVLSVLFAGVLFFSILRPLFDPIDDFTTPAPLTVHLDGGDQRTIYQRVARDQAEFGGGTGISPNALACTAVGPGGKRVDVTRADGFTYTKNDARYEAKLQFKASKSGDHVVRCVVRRSPDSPVVLAVGPHFGTVGFVARLVGFFAALFGGPLIGLILALVVFLMRQRSKKRLQEAERASWAPPGAGPPSSFMDAGR